jgi:hypothetical protein
MICNTPQQLWQRAKEALLSKLVTHPNLVRTLAMDVSLITPQLYNDWAKLYGKHGATPEANTPTGSSNPMLRLPGVPNDSGRRALGGSGGMPVGMALVGEAGPARPAPVVKSLIKLRLLPSAAQTVPEEAGEEEAEAELSCSAPRRQRSELSEAGTPAHRGADEGVASSSQVGRAAPWGSCRPAVGLMAGYGTHEPEAGGALRRRAWEGQACGPGGVVGLGWAACEERERGCAVRRWASRRPAATHPWCTGTRRSRRPRARPRHLRSRAGARTQTRSPGRGAGPQRPR